jgi:hypothetical protein
VDLEAYIEHDEECVSAFLRGFFDSEGCINKSGGLTVCNSDVDLICYVRSLPSKYFDVETTEPRQTHTMGTEIITEEDLIVVPAMSTISTSGKNPFLFTSKV